jgi:hypothetical protein
VWRTLHAPEYTTKRLTSEAQARTRSIWAAHLTTRSLLLSCHCRQNQSPRSLIKCSNPLKVVVTIFRPHAGRIAFCQLYGRPAISTSATRVPIPGVLIRAMSTCAVSAVVAVAIIMSITSRTHVAVGRTVLAAAVLAAAVIAASVKWGKRRFTNSGIDTRKWEDALQLVELCMRWRA